MPISSAPTNQAKECIALNAHCPSCSLWSLGYSRYHPPPNTCHVWRSAELVKMRDADKASATTLQPNYISVKSRSVTPLYLENDIQARAYADWQAVRVYKIDTTREKAHTRIRIRDGYMYGWPIHPKPL